MKYCSCRRPDGRKIPVLADGNCHCGGGDTRSAVLSGDTDSAHNFIREYLAAHVLSSAGVEKASEPPMRDQVSGKFR